MYKQYKSHTDFKSVTTRVPIETARELKEALLIYSSTKGKLYNSNKLLAELINKFIKDVKEL